MKLIFLALCVLVVPVRSNQYNYTLRAVVEKPLNISLAGEVGQECLSQIWSWHPPTQKESSISLEEFIGILPGNAFTIRVGDIFKVPREDLFIKWLAQIHPGARISRYDPLDPNVRARSTAYGILQSTTYDELRFFFRVHAEFKMGDNPALFLMPGRFFAHLHVDKNYTQIRRFELYLPNDRVFNCLIECGNLFSKIGDDEAPSISPDNRRLSEYRLILRPEPKWTEEMNISSEMNSDSSILGKSDDEKGEVCETTVDKEMFDSGDESAEDEKEIVTDSRDVAVSMGSMQFNPGEGEQEIIQTAVQEIFFPQMRLELVDPPTYSGSSFRSDVWITPVEAEKKLAVAMYPFLEVGYSTAYFEASHLAAAAGKGLLTVVLWGALDDASC
uniref:Uncharacterized protein n=1 Tax=Cryptomonas curvata TaxID=233186 RepID=A0A7S0MLY0_9CRYP|mmetsp:Transcript_46223/g.96735  ORF Transcript_46223/g.96735 Transcript_46223/m.96735 type:complete len:387 (+) Transcript_46223:51-1211(+)